LFAVRVAAPVPPRATAKVPVDTFDAFNAVIPEPSAVIAPAENSPDAPLETIVLAPLELDAVVLALAKVPLEIFEAFRLVMFSPLKAAVVDPVPPDAMGSADPRVREVKWVMASTTSVPLLNTYIVLPDGTAIPDPVEFLTVTVSATPLLTI